jgi:hypothetical protein
MKFLIMISPAVQTVYQCMKEYVVQHLTDLVAVLNTMHDIAEILLKLALNTNQPTNQTLCVLNY